VKEGILGVSSSTIGKFGTISEQCADEMATNVKAKLESDIGISFTGIAGPDPTEGKEVGTVFISISGKESITRQFHFQGNRNGIRNRAVKKGFELLYKYIQNY
jgi:nicotinamide-nucleotide amidase